MVVGPPKRPWGRAGADRRPQSGILLQTQPENPYRVIRDWSSCSWGTTRISQNSGQPAQAAALPHWLAADTSSSACNAFAPIWLLLATVQALPAKLQHAKGVLQLQKTVEGGLNLWTNNPTGKRRAHGWCYRTGDAELPAYMWYLEERRWQSRACLYKVCITAAQVLSYLSRRSDTRYVWLASMMNISWLMRSSAWIRPSSRPTTVILRSFNIITARNGYVFSRRAWETGKQAQTSP